LAATLLALLAASAPAAGAQVFSGTPAPRTVGETFKNIRALTNLKDAPAGDLWNTMQAISGSLSVTCNYCHVSQTGPFDTDAKKTKLKAREMISMTRAINDNNFAGRTVVTCNTCHRGSPRPVATPSPWYKTDGQVDSYYEAVLAAALDTSGAPGVGPLAERSAVALPTVGAVITKYRDAVGHSAVKSVRASGTLTQYVGIGPPTQPGGPPQPARPVQVTATVTVEFPDKAVIALAENRQVLNGDLAWDIRSARTLSLPPFQIEKLKDVFGQRMTPGKPFAPPMSPVKYETAAAARTVSGLDTIAGRAFVIIESRADSRVDKLFFDKQSGLLFKTQIGVPTVLGTKVEETTFEDYRAVNGVKLPYLITVHFMEDQWTFRISEIQTNLNLDASIFERPAARP
jgi:hypothetical protein